MTTKKRVKKPRTGCILTLPSTRLAPRSADLRSGAFPGAFLYLPGRRPALRWQCQEDAPRSDRRASLTRLPVPPPPWESGGAPGFPDRARSGNVFCLKTKLFCVRHAFVMFAQQVVAKIALKIAPDRMNMIRVVLRVVVFHQKRRALHPVVMAFFRLDAACPGEKKILRSG